MLFTCCHSKILVLAARGRQSMAPVSWQHVSHGFGRVAWFYNSRQPFCTSCDDICASWSKQFFGRFSLFTFEETCKISLAAEGRRESLKARSMCRKVSKRTMHQADYERRLMAELLFANWAGDRNTSINSILIEWRKLSDCRKKMQKTLEHNVEHLFQLRGCCPSVLQADAPRIAGCDARQRDVTLSWNRFLLKVFQQINQPAEPSTRNHPTLIKPRSRQDFLLGGPFFGPRVRQRSGVFLGFWCSDSLDFLVGVWVLGKWGLVHKHFFGWPSVSWNKTMNG